MKHLIIAILLAGLSASAAAQSAGADATNTSATESAAQAVNGGNTLVLPSSPAHTRATVKATPSMSMGSFAGSFSSDYCSGTSQATLSGVGFGIGGGRPVVDDVCQLLRVYERTMQASASASTPELRITLERVAIGVICLSRPDVKAVFQAEGLCLEPKKQGIAAYTGSDNEIRVQLGMAPIK